MTFSPERLLVALERALGDLATPPTGLCIALSGGLDSTVLLAALAATREAGSCHPLRAIHVDHGLHRDAALWSARSAAVAARHGVACETVRVDARPAPGESPEAVARMARYGALAQRLQPGEVLLTAHHGDDQLETVLLQWLRGGGLRSVAGMRPAVPFALGWHVRPLLGFTRAELQAWAQGAGLDWLDDPSNLDTRFDRNYLRLEVLPALRKRWPAAARTVGRVAAQAADVLELDVQAAASDLAAARQGATLSMAALRPLTPSRQRRLLRAWLREAALPMPGAAMLEALRHDMLAAADDRMPEARWPGAVVHRYRDRLYATTTLREAEAWRPGAWRPGEAFDLGSLGRLELYPAHTIGLSRSRLSGPLSVVARPSGSAFRPAGAAHHRPLRKWFQERGVLPWLRSQLPIIVCDDEIVAIGDLAYGGGFAAVPGEDSWRVSWHGRPLLTESEATAPCGDG